VKTVELVRIAMAYFVSELVTLIGKIVNGKDAGLAAAWRRSLAELLTI
jgi:hypothetical protein